jgi:hypothetical protein
MTLRGALIKVATELNEEECGVVLALAERIQKGRRQYGPMSLDKDPRHMPQEALEEALDLAAYVSMALYRLRRT